MKKLFTVLIATFLFCLPALSQRDTVNFLIISEYQGGEWVDHYNEITNVGDSTLNLSDFYFGNFNDWLSGWDWTGIPTIADPQKFGTRLPDMELPPGKSLVIKGVWDAPDDQGRTQNLPGFLNAEYFFPVHWDETSTGAGKHEFWYAPELEMWGKDSIDSGSDLPKGRGGALWQCFPEGDSVMIDMCNIIQDGVDRMKHADAIAGIEGAYLTHTLVRKFSITKGNTNFDIGRGVDITDSEWLPVPMWTGRTTYSTVGTHGDFSIDFTSDRITVDDTTMTVPWGLYKGDSIVAEMDLGPGMAWGYTEDSLDFADSAFATVQAGDILRLYACGNDLEIKDYTIQVLDPADDMARVFPKRRMRFDAMEEEDFDGRMWGDEPYYVTLNQQVIDTIGDVPFAERVDTLFNYLQKAPAANWEIIWVDTMERVDLKRGDILLVTAEDGTTKKEYFIDVQDYLENTDARLGAITWPDKPFYLEDWNQDTIPLFNPASFLYQVTLPYGTMSIPAFKAIPMDNNAVIEEDRATNLRGSLDQRTTTFTVTAEDDTTVLEYSVLFKVEKPLSKLQPYYAEPFFSEIVAGYKVHDCWYEIVNVGDVPLDLSRYLIAQGGSTPAEAITDIFQGTDEEAFLNRYDQGYVPGYKFSDDSLVWQVTPGKLYPDGNVDPFIDPGDIFLLGSTNHYQIWKVSPIGLANADAITSINYNSWGIENLADNSMYRTWNAMYLFRIDNDSILNGTKEVYEDPTDYTLIDVVGNPAAEDLFGVAIGGKFRVAHSETMRRLPFVYKGDVGLDTIAEQLEWTNNNKWEEGWNNDRIEENLGLHSFDPVTVHMSTISSITYLVSDGYKSPQTIQSDFSATTVETFFGNVSKADTGQTLTIISGADSSVLDMAENVSGDDTLVVVSGDGVNTTKYVLIDQPLSGNALLVVKEAYAGSYSVFVDGDQGTITGSGIKWGRPIKEVLAALKVPDLAILNVIDQNGNLVPMKDRNYDTVLIDVVLHDSVFLEVVPQNGINIITYQMKPEAASDDAFVVSSVFLVDEDDKTISLIPGGLAVPTFLKDIHPATGATICILDKYGFKRDSATISMDDKLQVVSEDGTNTVYYYLNFFDEEDPDNNLAPTLSLATSSANVTVGETITLTATADDDGMPLPAGLNVQWDIISGDGVTIASPNALVTDVTFSKAGPVVLQITVDDGEISRTETVNVGVTTPDNLAPTVAVAFADTTLVVGATINVMAEADDDGNPIGSSLTYEWSVKTGDAGNVTIATSDALASDVSFTTEGVYTLQITVSDGEAVAIDIIVVVVTSETAVEPLLEPELKLYPNPVADMLNIEVLHVNKASFTVMIFNITGQPVFTAEMYQSRQQIDISRFGPGMYFVKVKADRQVFNRRIQVIK